MGTRFRPSLILALASLFVGCASYTERVSKIRDSYYTLHVDQAQLLVEQALGDDPLNADVLRLEQAMIHLAGGRPNEAEQVLRQARDRFDELEDTGQARAALSYVTDDRRRVYPGEDYEKVLIRAMLALCNLMHDGGDAEAYSLQVIDKQQQIIQAASNNKGENPKLNYQPVALAPYLRGVLREATHLDYDDAERSYTAVVNWQPNFIAAKHDLHRAATGHHSAKGNGVLYVFTLVGRGPYKEQATEIPTTASLLIAGEILSATGEHTVPPNVAPIKVPKVVAQANGVASVGIDVGGRPIGATETVTDVTQLAVQQYAAIYPQVIARAVARRCLKKGLLYGAKEVGGVSNGSLSNIAIDVAGIAWEATESADTRCWSLLPDKIQVLRVELPAGEHAVTLRALGLHGQVAGNGTTQNVRIADGRNTYLLASMPGSRVVGKVLVSEP
jgi:hypothetical protein